MRFSHHPSLWAQYPELVAGVLHARGIRADARAEAAVARHEAVARARLAATGSESDFAEIQAWRRAFARMGLKPTQYRCASESLLRRLRKEGTLPRIHPLIDLCNAVSVAYAIPVAVLDLARIEGGLQVRPAAGDERYLTGDRRRPARGVGRARAHAAAVGARAGVRLRVNGGPRFAQRGLRGDRRGDQHFSSR